MRLLAVNPHRRRLGRFGHGPNTRGAAHPSSISVRDTETCRTPNDQVNGPEQRYLLVLDDRGGGNSEEGPATPPQPRGAVAGHPRCRTAEEMTTMSQPAPAHPCSHPPADTRPICSTLLAAVKQRMRLFMGGLL